MGTSAINAPDTVVTTPMTGIPEVIDDGKNGLLVPDGDAGTVAGLMVEADLAGLDTHGSFRLPQYMRRLRDGGTNPKPQGRVVRDGQVITGGGVTAGIDFALQLVAELEGPEVAQSLQLGMEYDPQPPFDVGSPASAPAPLTEKLRGVYAKRRDEFAAQLDRLS